jgi:hypothetical protein
LISLKLIIFHWNSTMGKLKVESKAQRDAAGKRPRETRHPHSATDKSLQDIFLKLLTAYSIGSYQVIYRLCNF